MKPAPFILRYEALKGLSDIPVDSAQMTNFSSHKEGAGR
ncbi:hypothetical protein SAMN05216534_0136 [Candidatus Aquiluna sp. UB-MaderosW2red]|nr:hypothetical protein SAMN05216534_0136 [Candidatus Aquiluna sp. UB-MaderosW2red]